MKKSVLFGLLAILMFFVGCMTLGAIGTAAVDTHFYWLAFVLNIGVYGVAIYGLAVAGSAEAKTNAKKQPEKEGE